MHMPEHPPDCMQAIEVTYEVACMQALLQGQLDVQSDRQARATTAAERRRKALHAHRPDDAAVLEQSASLAAAQAANKALLAVLPHAFWHAANLCDMHLCSEACIRESAAILHAETSRPISANVHNLLVVMLS